MQIIRELCDRYVTHVKDLSEQARVNVTVTQLSNTGAKHITQLTQIIMQIYQANIKQEQECKAHRDTRDFSPKFPTLCRDWYVSVG